MLQRLLQALAVIIVLQFLFYVLILFCGQEQFQLCLGPNGVQGKAPVMCGSFPPNDGKHPLKQLLFILELIALYRSFEQSLLQHVFRVFFISQYSICLTEQGLYFFI